MKFTAVAITALASVVAATPNAIPRCVPATYQCGVNGYSWDVCNTNGVWIFAGNCPLKTICEFNTENHSPYCIPTGYKAVKN